MEISKIQIDLSIHNYMTLKVYTNDKPKPISGHRFVSLLGENKYSNDFTLFLDFLGLRKVEENAFMSIGREFENKLLDHVWGKKTYVSYEYEEHNGDMFGVEGFNGLIDGKHFYEDKIAEVKTYFNFKKLKQKYYDVKNKKSIKEIPRAYWLQTRLYLWLLNQQNPNTKIKKADVITCFMNVKQPQIKDENINIFKVWHNKNDGFDDLILQAKQKKQWLMQPNKDVDGNFYTIMSKRTKANEKEMKHLLDLDYTEII